MCCQRAICRSSPTEREDINKKLLKNVVEVTTKELLLGQTWKIWRKERAGRKHMSPSCGNGRVVSNKVINFRKKIPGHIFVFKLSVTIIKHAAHSNWEACDVLCLLTSSKHFSSKIKQNKTCRFVKEYGYFKYASNTFPWKRLHHMTFKLQNAFKPIGLMVKF